MGLIGVIKSLFSLSNRFTGVKDGVYYKDGIPFTGMKTETEEDNHIRDPYGYIYRDTKIYYESGKEVKREEGEWLYSG